MNEELIISLKPTRKEKIKDEYLQLICDIAYDYDGCNTVKSLKELIDEIVNLAVRGKNNDDKWIAYMSASGKKNFNILHEEIKGDDIDE